MRGATHHQLAEARWIEDPPKALGGKPGASARERGGARHSRGGRRRRRLGRGRARSREPWARPAADRRGELRNTAAALRSLPLSHTPARAGGYEGRNRPVRSAHRDPGVHLRALVQQGLQHRRVAVQRGIVEGGRAPLRGGGRRGVGGGESEGVGGRGEDRPPSGRGGGGRGLFGAGRGGAAVAAVVHAPRLCRGRLRRPRGGGARTRGGRSGSPSGGRWCRAARGGRKGGSL